MLNVFQCLLYLVPINEGMWFYSQVTPKGKAQENFKTSKCQLSINS